jgi:hypothetical protein
VQCLRGDEWERGGYDREMKKMSRERRPMFGVRR